MSATRTLGAYASRLKYEDLPPPVVAQGKLQKLDALGNAIGAYPLPLSSTFLMLAKSVGGGREESTLIGDGGKVSIPLAALGNGALTTMMDYTSGRGVLGVPAALAAGEVRDISGKELIASVVAGYEVVYRIVDSMSMSPERAQKLTGETVSVFAATTAAWRALGLDQDAMLSAFGMAGIYTPVPAGAKWLRDEGLLPRKDIKQGWSWMCMTGAFAAVSAWKGLRALQENNILDGNKGLWRMLGMDIFHEEKLTEGLGDQYKILQFGSKAWPGCGATHPSMEVATSLVREHDITPRDIERIDVTGQKSYAVGFHEQEPEGLCDREFSIPYQVAASLLAGDRGASWYTDATAARPDLVNLAHRVKLSLEGDGEGTPDDRSPWATTVEIVTKSGKRYSGDFDELRMATGAEELTNKFVAATRQVIDQRQVDRIQNAVDNLETVGKISELIEMLRIPHPKI